MNKCEEDVPWLVVYVLQVALAFIEESEAPGLVALHQLAGWLVDNQEMIVLVDHLHDMVLLRML